MEPMILMEKVIRILVTGTLYGAVIFGYSYLMATIIRIVWNDITMDHCAFNDTMSIRRALGFMIFLFACTSQILVVTWCFSKILP